MQTRNDLPHLLNKRQLTGKGAEIMVDRHMNKIDIIVRGASGVGKTTIATIIQKTLNSVGLQATYHNDEDNDLDRHARKLVSLQQSGVEIAIHEQQTIRESGR